MTTKRESSDLSTAAVIPAYVEYLATAPAPQERRIVLTKEIVRECHARYCWGLYLLIRRMNLGHDDAQDILQEVLIRLFRHLESGSGLPEPGALTTWLRRVTRNTVFDHIRRVRGKRREAELVSVARRLAEQRRQADELELKELPQVVDRIFDEHTTTETRIIFERWQDGLTYAEIAEELGGRSAEAVRGVIRKVTSLLRAELAELGWSVP